MNSKASKNKQMIIIMEWTSEIWNGYSGVDILDIIPVLTHGGGLYSIADNHSEGRMGLLIASSQAK